MFSLPVNSRGKLLPDPEFDEITALFYCYQSEDENRIENGRNPDRQVGVIAVDPTGDLGKRLGKSSTAGEDGGYTFQTVTTELEMINEFIDKVRLEWDPEIVAGFDVQQESWGYLIDRAEHGYCEL